MHLENAKMKKAMPFFYLKWYLFKTVVRLLYQGYNLTKVY